MANPLIVTLTANTEEVVTLDANYGAVRVTVVADPADRTYLNTRNAAIPTTAGLLSTLQGNEVLPAGVLCSVTLADETGGAVSVVRIRSTGTPTLTVRGL